MIENATVSIYQPVQTKNAEGTLIKTWGYKQTPKGAPVDTIRADVQPHKIDQAQLTQWGLSNRLADTKKMYFSDCDVIQMNYRAYVVSDFPGEPAVYYEIKGVNHWSMHGKALLVPVQGE